MSATAPAVNVVCVSWNWLQVAHIGGCGPLAWHLGAGRCLC